VQVLCVNNKRTTMAKGEWIKKRRAFIMKVFITKEGFWKECV